MDLNRRGGPKSLPSQIKPHMMDPEKDQRPVIVQSYAKTNKSRRGSYDRGRVLGAPQRVEVNRDGEEGNAIILNDDVGFEVHHARESLYFDVICSCWSSSKDTSKLNCGVCTKCKLNSGY